LEISPQELLASNGINSSFTPAKGLEASDYQLSASLRNQDVRLPDGSIDFIKSNALFRGSGTDISKEGRAKIGEGYPSELTFGEVLQIADVQSDVIRTYGQDNKFVNGIDSKNFEYEVNETVQLNPSSVAEDLWIHELHPYLGFKFDAKGEYSIASEYLDQVTYQVRDQSAGMYTDIHGSPESVLKKYFRSDSENPINYGPRFRSNGILEGKLNQIDRTSSWLNDWEQIKSATESLDSSLYTIGFTDAGMNQYNALIDRIKVGDFDALTPEEFETLKANLIDFYEAGRSPWSVQDFSEGFVRAKAIDTLIVDDYGSLDQFGLESKVPSADRVRARIDELENSHAVPTQEEWLDLLKPYEQKMKPYWNDE
jgi:hypothetical protein